MKRSRAASSRRSEAERLGAAQSSASQLKLELSPPELSQACSPVTVLQASSSSSLRIRRRSSWIRVRSGRRTRGCCPCARLSASHRLRIPVRSRRCTRRSRWRRARASGRLRRGPVPPKRRPGRSSGRSSWLERACRGACSSGASSCPGARSVSTYGPRASSLTGPSGSSRACASERAFGRAPAASPPSASSDNVSVRAVARRADGRLVMGMGESAASWRLIAYRLWPSARAAVLLPGRRASVSGRPSGPTEPDRTGRGRGGRSRLPMRPVTIAGPSAASARCSAKRVAGSHRGTRPELEGRAEAVLSSAWRCPSTRACPGRAHGTPAGLSRRRRPVSSVRKHAPDVDGTRSRRSRVEPDPGGARRRIHALAHTCAAWVTLGSDASCSLQPSGTRRPDGGPSVVYPRSPGSKRRTSPPRPRSIVYANSPERPSSAARLRGSAARFDSDD